MRDPAASLAKLTLCNFEVGTNMKSTGEMTATFTMEDCVLDDTRPEMKDGITKYVCALNFKFRDELTILHGYITPPLCCYNLYLVLTFSLIRRALINDDNNGIQILLLTLTSQGQSPVTLMVCINTYMISVPMLY